MADLDSEENLDDTDRSSPPDFFSQAIQLATDILPSTPLPLQMFCTGTTGFHLNQRPDLPPSTVDEVADKFQLPDL